MGKRAQLALQTVDLTTAFMAWVVLSTLLPFIRQDIDVPPPLVAVVTAVPVVLGSVLRIPFGCWTSSFGARKMFACSFAFLLVPLWVVSEAQTYHELVLGGALLGIAGAVFSVGVTSLPKYYPKSRQGFVNGVYGLGNAGTAATAFGAPPLAVCFGWQTTVKLYLILMAAMSVLNLLAGDREEPKERCPLTRQVRTVWGEKALWMLSLFYFVTFGAFMALTVFLPNFLAADFQMEGTAAGALTGAFIVLVAGLRPLGGWLGDRFDCMRLMAGVFLVIGAGAVVLAFADGLAALLAGVYLVGAACGIGNGVVFKLVPALFGGKAGAANGIVSMTGGLGGFFPPFALYAASALTGSHAMAFLLFALVAVLCLALALRSRFS